MKGEMVNTKRQSNFFFLFIEIDVLNFLRRRNKFEVEPSSFPVSPSAHRGNKRSAPNWLQFGAISSVVRLEYVEPRQPFIHNGSGNLSVEFNNFPAPRNEFVCLALQFHLI